MRLIRIASAFLLVVGVACSRDSKSDEAARGVRQPGAASVPGTAPGRGATTTSRTSASKGPTTDPSGQPGTGEGSSRSNPAEHDRLALPGVYRYEVNDDSLHGGEARVEVRPPVSGVQERVLIIDHEKYLFTTTSYARAQDGTLEEVRRHSRTSDDDKSDVLCDWSPNRIALPSSPRPQATWRSDATCSFHYIDRDSSYRVVESGRVERVESVEVAERVFDGFAIHVEGTQTDSSTGDRTTYVIDATVTDTGIVLRSTESLRVAPGGSAAMLLTKNRSMRLTAAP